MTINGGREIPPLDDAADIARTTGPRRTFAGVRNWAGFALLLAGALAALIAVIATVVGATGIGAGCAVLAAAAIGVGIGLIVVLNRRRRVPR
jgi:FtsH-binding integral membrane protein